jgi:hypothetical protein
MDEEDEQEGDGGGRAERSHGAMAFHFEVEEAFELQPGRTDPLNVFSNPFLLTTRALIMNQEK